MTLTAKVEKEGFILFIKKFVGDKAKPGEPHHKAEPLGSSHAFGADEILSLAAAPENEPPHPGSYIDPMVNQVVVHSEEVNEGGVVDGIGVAVGKSRTVKGIIFTGY